MDFIKDFPIFIASILSLSLVPASVYHSTLSLFSRIDRDSLFLQHTVLAAILPITSVRSEYSQTGVGFSWPNVPLLLA